MGDMGCDHQGHYDIETWNYGDLFGHANTHLGEPYSSFQISTWESTFNSDGIFSTTHCEMVNNSEIPSDIKELLCTTEIDEIEESYDPYEYTDALYALEDYS